MPCGSGQVMKVVHHTAVWETWKARHVKVKVAQSCLTLCDPMDYTIHGILQARIWEWLAVPFSRGSSQPRDRPRSLVLQADSLPIEPPGKPKNPGVGSLSLFQHQGFFQWVSSLHQVAKV